MKAIMLMFDSLNRHMLSAYGNDETITPNFARLAQRCVTFDKSYVGSLPCMPARRELHTGRLNFLHRSWGPIEPYDDSIFELMREKKGVYSHLISDHYHYWEDGGATYHNRYSSWEIVRGQEGDHWKGRVNPIDLPEHLGRMSHQDQINRRHIRETGEYTQIKAYDLGLDFLRENKDADNWFLQLETFDPHEPFFSPDRCRERYGLDADPLCFDWPNYAPVSPEEAPYVDHVRKEYMALLTLCDEQIGRILDFMDANNMWEDTMLIVNTDHGFLLGEYGWWAKGNEVNFHEEVSHTPLFIYDPRSRAVGRRDMLVQTTDLAPTILDFFGLEPTPDMTGKPLRDAIAENKPVHDAIIWGIHGAQINCTDGRYVYILAPNEENEPLYEYTLMPTHMFKLFHVEELHTMREVPPFRFTKGCKLLKIRDLRMGMTHKGQRFETLLYDLDTDPGETHPIRDEAVEHRLKQTIVRLMEAADAPEEQYQRLGLADYHTQS
ncbi:sulfatase-like hydrolase/transferase [Ruminococcaceae bacterium OttesenSCG-928-L11]|nr:sulfatase-like hydrolase/transferase [Ruminococcaceae bacterium OttesenSCG-928-L11]